MVFVRTTASPCVPLLHRMVAPSEIALLVSASTISAIHVVASFFHEGTPRTPP